MMIMMIDIIDEAINGTLLPPKSLRRRDSTTSNLNDKILITKETRQYDHANFLQPSWARPPPFS